MRIHISDQKRTLRSQLELWTIVSTSVIFIIVFGIIHIWVSGKAKADIESSSQILASYYSEKFAHSFKLSTEIANWMAVPIQTGLVADPVQLKTYMKQALLANPQLYGISVAFEPGTYKTGQKYYAPYYHYQGDDIAYVQRGTEEYNYFRRDWYTAAREAGKGIWTEPYYDDGAAEILMVSYSVPVFDNKRFCGVVTVDLSLEDIRDEIDTLALPYGGYAFILSRLGRYIAYPDPVLVMGHELESANSELYEAMTGKNIGFIKAPDPHYRKTAWIFYRPIDRTEFSVAVIYPVANVLKPVRRFQMLLLAIALCALGALYVMAVRVARTITDPITELADRVKSLGNLDFMSSLTISTSNYEIWQLTVAFNKMMNALKKHIADIRSMTTEKERLAGELEVAARIQNSILPNRFPPFPDRGEIDLYAVNLPAKEMGGDFYDYFFIDDDHLGFVIADVSDKGVPAAIFMAISRTVIKSTAFRTGSPAECLTLANSLLCAENEECMFVTVFYGVMDIRTGKISYANAGHNPPFVIGADGVVKMLDSTGDLPLGVANDATYASRETVVGIGDHIYLYTDGVTEAANISQELFSEARLRNHLETVYDSVPSHVVMETVTGLQQFSETAEQSDDITILSIKRLA